MLSNLHLLAPLGCISITVTFALTYTLCFLNEHTEGEPIPYISTVISYVPESCWGALGFGITAGIIAGIDVVKHISTVGFLSRAGKLTVARKRLCLVALFFGFMSSVGLLGTGAVQTIFLPYIHKGFAGAIFIGAGFNMAFLCVVEAPLIGTAPAFTKGMLWTRRTLAVIFWVLFVALVIVELGFETSIGSALLELVDVAVYVGYMQTYWKELSGVSLDIVADLPKPQEYSKVDATETALEDV